MATEHRDADGQTSLAKRGTGRQRQLAALAGLVIVALMTAGCAEATNSLNPSRETIKTAHRHGLGTILADEEGRTVYLFLDDPPGRSACYGACASVWPPVTTAGMPKPEGIATSKLTTIHRSDGSTQVAYAGHPLYYLLPSRHQQRRHLRRGHLPVRRRVVRALSRRPAGRTQDRRQRWLLIKPEAAT